MSLRETAEQEQIGWELVRFTSEELDELVRCVDANNTERASDIVDGAYERLFVAV